MNNKQSTPDSKTPSRFKLWRKRILRWSLGCFLIWYILALPQQLFDDHYSTVVLDARNNLLAARIADDGQWRFPECDSVPHKFETCLIAFEDRNFYGHFGVSIKGTCRAISQNWRAGHVVSGGSTLTMQVVRMMLKNPRRTFIEKIREMILATRVEWAYSKKEILNLYASHAPFGTNVVGLEAASWRYFGRPPHQLSWAESATLAVLPNAPGLIYPGRNQDRLKAKRDRLLNYLHQSGVIDQTTWKLALSEPLPQKPFPLPQVAPHLLDHLMKTGYRGNIVHSTIDENLQAKANQLLQQHAYRLRENKIYNGAVIITSVKTGKILAYVGNTSFEEAEYGTRVDCIQAPRSTGSILKPLLYQRALEEGLIMPQQLVTDIPVQYGSYSPKNFSGQYEGALPINRALARSLNVPMVHLLHLYGVNHFHHDLQQYGFTTFKRPARHYGLSLILGGGEAKLGELSQVYTGLAQQLRYGRIRPCYVDRSAPPEPGSEMTSWQSRASIYSTFEALIEVNRPDEENNWRVFSSARKIAWKTGTSFGFRDAWAIGVTPDYVVAVWVGNADGEGRPGLTGVGAAAPLLFDLFGQLPQETGSAWFKKPQQGMIRIAVCRESGFRASEYCGKPVYRDVPKNCARTMGCSYHRLIHVNAATGLRVDRDCEAPARMKTVPWFILPAVAERFYRSNHPNYQALPAWQESCLKNEGNLGVAIIYPKPNAQLFVPIQLDGTTGMSIFEATLRQPEGKLFWHLDQQYLGETKDIHQLAVNPAPGKHVLTVMDENGSSQTVKFMVLNRSK